MNLMTWCRNGKFFELRTLHKVNAELGGSVMYTCLIFEDTQWILTKFDIGSPRIAEFSF